VLPFAATPLESSSAEGDGTFTLRFLCPCCRQPSEVSGVDPAGWQAWRSGTGGLIDSAFPGLSLDEREVLKTGIHPACWDEMCPGDDEE
jgi:hypothetical protein